MSKRFYPAVLERAEGGMFAVWFPDFPGCVAAGRTQEEAAAKAEDALAAAVQQAAESDAELPAPTPFDSIETPADADVVTFMALGVSPPDPSERVNVYLPKRLIERADAFAAEWGMSRSSLFGLALTRLLAYPISVVTTAEAEKPKKKGRRP
jgi:predicted RNase H-like HicB family nuclease